MKAAAKAMAALILFSACGLAGHAQKPGVAPQQKPQPPAVHHPAQTSTRSVPIKTKLLKTVLPKTILLKTRSTVRVANSYASSLDEKPAKCGPNGELYAVTFSLQLKAPPGSQLSQSVVGIDRDGKQFLTLDPGRITDVPHARLISFFPAESDFFFLVGARADGSLDGGARPEGGVDGLFHKTDSESEYISRFDHDGHYLGSIQIDIPITGLHLGVLPTGQFVVAGIDEKDRTQVVLLKPSGALDRYMELPKKPGSNKPQEDVPEWIEKGERLYGAAFSDLVGDGQDMLLVSPDSSSVIKIHSSGVVEEIRLRSGATSILSIQPLAAGWLAILHHSGASKRGVVARLYSRDDGHLMGDYLYSQTADLVFGCMYEGELTFLRRESNGRLELLTASPAEKGETAGEETRQ